MRNRITIFFVLLALAGCRDRETEVVILSLNDIHGYIDNLDKVAAYVNMQREQHPNVLLLSAGDLFSGNPVVDFYADKGYPIVDLMNDLRFDASVLGNHELDYGQETFAKRVAQAAFPFVCANISADSSPIPALPPYLMLSKADNNILIVGLTQELPEAHSDRLKNLRFFSPQSALEKYLPLRQKSSLLIALTHLGVPEDSLLAERFGEVDLIVGGHTHTRLDSGLTANGVLITQAERHARYIGRTTVTLRNGRVASKRNQLVDVAQLTQRDTLVARKVREYNSNPELNRAAATLAGAIAGRVNIGNFFCDAIRSETGTDITLQNVKGIRLDTLHKGKLTIGDLYRADPFGNEIVCFDMTGSDLHQLIKTNYLHFNRIDLCVSGISYKIQPTSGDVMVSITLPNGAPLSSAKRYSVAMNSYMATKPAEYKLPPDSKGKSLGTTTAEAVISYLKKNQVIRYTSPVRGETFNTN
ncbi:MAG: bifunctional metallophosphatase/5'-nucleotidase [Prevotellaceae bacterium]|jgi:2',3'-cyclic-nucleotide 2'-phosphodiesterase (5'-nucleotidase family)|nr:bifunctional metallophosphatase/5'-nucleotidase [Prevotellaceae bacterium]